MATRKRKNVAPEGETKEQAFVRLATQRVSKALKAIKLIGNLGRYPHNSTHTNKIVTALREATEKVEYALGGEGIAEEEGFKL